MSRFFGRLGRFLDQFEKYVAAVTLGFAALLVFLQVILRYFFGISPSYFSELIRYSIVWSVFIGGSYALRQNKHLTIDILLLRMSERTKQYIQIVASAIGAIFCLYLAWMGLMVVLDTIHLGERSSSALRMPMYIPRLAVPVGAFLLCIRFFERIVDSVAQLNKMATTEYTERKVDVS
jgi:C4-dicarboxylate transporter DctQ subunit